MSRDKPMEEMAKILADVDPFPNRNPFSIFGWKKFASALYKAGYRKSTDVAEEIFAELKKVMIDEYRYPIIAELKKKYTEGGE